MTVRLRCRRLITCRHPTSTYRGRRVARDLPRAILPIPKQAVTKMHAQCQSMRLQGWLLVHALETPALPVQGKDHRPRRTGLA